MTIERSEWEILEGGINLGLLLADCILEAGPKGYALKLDVNKEAKLLMLKNFGSQLYKTKSLDEMIVFLTKFKKNLPTKNGV